jgi:hypothetical protein
VNLRREESRYTTVVPIVWPDGRWVGFMIHVGQQWFGPFVSIGGARLV